MVYWHLEHKAVCVYSHLKTVSSSEVAAMIEGVLRHCTDLEIEQQYVDSHGQSEVAFAFCHLLGFQLVRASNPSTRNASTAPRLAILTLTPTLRRS